jgi:putative tricarboxylic transport membrane protein
VVPLMFERILNVLWCLLGLGTMVNSWSLRLTGSFGPESGFFPFICGALITVCGLVLMFKASSTAAPKPDWPRAAALGRVCGVVTGLVAMAATLPYLGFAVSSGLTTFVLLQTVERSRLLESLIITVVSVAVVILVFGRLLGMNLPRGPWGW